MGAVGKIPENGPRERHGESIRLYTISCKAFPCFFGAVLFFTLGKELVLVTRCVSEGRQAVSLAYAVGYESHLPLSCEKRKGSACLCTPLAVEPLMPKKRREPGKDRPPQISRVFAEEKFDDLDVAVLQSLSQLMPSGLDELSKHSWPPKNILKWLSQADLPKTHGLLIATLRRWHELRSVASR